MSEYYAVRRSNKYLQHFGILGMRWGHHKVPELKPHTSPYPKHVESNEMKSIWSKIDKMEQAYYKNPQLVDKYQKLCAKDWAKKNAHQFDGGYNEAYKTYYHGYKYGDLDQGESYERYINSNAKLKQKSESLHKQYRDANVRANPYLRQFI